MPKPLVSTFATRLAAVLQSDKIIALQSERDAILENSREQHNAFNHASALFIGHPERTDFAEAVDAATIQYHASARRIADIDAELALIQAKDIDIAVEEAA